MRRHVVVVAVACLLSFSGRSAWGQLQYAVTDLGTLGGSSSYAYGVNNSGEVVGNSYTSSGYDHAFLYSNGKMTDLGAPLGNSYTSTAYAINDSGQVVGDYLAHGAYQAVLYSNGKWTALGSGHAWDINDSGQVVGDFVSGNVTYAFLYSNGKTTNGWVVSGSTTVATSISETGQVAGYITPPGYSVSQAVLFNTNEGETVLGNGLAEGINDNGQVVGYTATLGANDYQAFLCTNGVLQGLGKDGAINSFASGINHSGQVVGYLEESTAGPQDAHAFIYQDGTMTDLNNLLVPGSGWTVRNASAINDSGQIVGQGINPQGQYDAFLLTPVPEPSTLVLLGIGAVSLLAYAWRRRGKIAVAVACLLSFAGSGAWGVEYAVTDLGTLGGSASYAKGINASGQVVGYSYTSSGNWGAFLYSNGKMTDLGAFSGDSQSQAYGINASGQVVGFSFTSGSGDQRAFLYGNGTMTDLGTLPGGSVSEATGINDSGQVTGWAMTSSGYDHAFFYANGTMTDLGTLPGGSQSAALGINASGQVTGWAVTSSGYNHAFLYSNGTMNDLGTLSGGGWSWGRAINDSGQVAGGASINSVSPSFQHAFMDSQGTMADLGTLNGETCTAFGINASGQVVGGIQPNAGSAERAFLYENGTTSYLNALIAPGSGWTLEEADGINSSGQIVGFGLNPLGQEHAFLLSPVPEPSTLVLFGIGAVSLLVYVWRRRFKTCRKATVTRLKVRKVFHFTRFSRSTAMRCLRMVRWGVCLAIFAAWASHGQAQSLTTLCSFNGTNGSYPYAGVTLSGSTLYGAANMGGANNDGTVFSLPVTGGSPTTLWSFTGGTDGKLPMGDLAISGSTLYGTTYQSWSGGGGGTVFSVPVTGGSLTTLCSFNGNNGSQLYAGVTRIGSTLYGATEFGGANNDGTVFSVPVTGGSPTTLCSFNGANGIQPYTGLTLVGSTLYGTTRQGGAYGDGTVFSVPLTGGSPTTLYSFQGTNGMNPDAGLTLVGSTLYGTTEFGGVFGNGTVFSIPLTGGSPRDLWSFSGTNGMNPHAGLTLVGSTLYGTTQNGGDYGNGTVFSIPLTSGPPTTLWSFTGGTDGEWPFAALTLSDSTLYGTTEEGGAYGEGTVFAISVPEPSTIVLLGIGAVSLLAYAWRRRTRTAFAHYLFCANEIRG